MILSTTYGQEMVLLTMYADEDCSEFASTLIFAQGVCSSLGGFAALSDALTTTTTTTSTSPIWYKFNCLSNGVNVEYYLDAACTDLKTKGYFSFGCNASFFPGSTFACGTPKLTGAMLTRYSDSSCTNVVYPEMIVPTSKCFSEATTSFTPDSSTIITCTSTQLEVDIYNTSAECSGKIADEFTYPVGSCTKFNGGDGYAKFNCYGNSGPFYEQWWFYAAAGGGAAAVLLLIIIIIIIALCCCRKDKYERIND